MARGAVSGISPVPKLGTSRVEGFFKITCDQLGHKLKIAKEDFSLWTNWPQVVLRNYSQSGMIPLPFMLAQSGKQGKAVQLYKVASNVNLYRFTIFANSLVGATSPIPFEHHLPMMAARSF